MSGINSEGSDVLADLGRRCAMRPFSVFILLVCAVPRARADEATPAATNVPRAEYPRVHPVSRVTFRLRAPDAKAVRVQPGGADNGLGKGPYDMERGPDGTWSVTIPPAVPGFHYYWLVVDGVAVNDPGSETFFGYGKPTSGVEVPEKGVTRRSTGPASRTSPSSRRARRTSGRRGDGRSTTSRPASSETEVLGRPPWPIPGRSGGAT
jgi:hypothetical protein